MRLFTAIDVPEPQKAALEALIEQFRPLAPLRWSPTANLHVTTKFIGEWPEERLDELRKALSAVTPSGPMEIAIDGLGWFPNPHQPRVFWAAVKAPPELASLAAATEDRLEPLGIAREDRPFRPHLTLARINGPADLKSLRRAVALLPSTDFGRFKATVFHLFLSAGGKYTKLDTFPLVRPAEAVK